MIKIDANRNVDMRKLRDIFLMPSGFTITEFISVKFLGLFSHITKEEYTQAHADNTYF